VTDPKVLQAARQAGEQVARGFEAFAEAWRECRIARGAAGKDTKPR
jgi:hypothetical protein